MLDHTLFDERPESQDRAIKVLERLGYQYIPRSQAEILRGRLASVLFPEVLHEFLHRQSFFYRGRQTPFSESLDRQGDQRYRRLSGFGVDVGKQDHLRYAPGRQQL